MRIYRVYRIQKKVYGTIRYLAENLFYNGKGSSPLPTCPTLAAPFAPLRQAALVFWFSLSDIPQTPKHRSKHRPKHYSQSSLYMAASMALPGARMS